MTEKARQRSDLGPLKRHNLKLRCILAVRCQTCLFTQDSRSAFFANTRRTYICFPTLASKNSNHCSGLAGCTCVLQLPIQVYWIFEYLVYFCNFKVQIRINPMISLIISVVCKLKCPSNYNFLSIDFVFHNVYVCPIICHSLKRQFCAYHLRFQENLRMSQNILTLHLCGGRCQCKPKSDLSVSFEMLTGCGSSEHSGVNCCAIFICYLSARWQE